MAGRNLFADEPVPQSTPAGNQTTVAGRNLFQRSAEELRAERLRKIARGTLGLMEGAPDAGEVLGHQFTLGLQKPLTGLTEGFFGGDDDSSFGERYRAGTEAYQERLDESRKTTGSTPAGIVGSLFSGGPARSAGQTILRQIGDAATAGAIEGAANNAESLSDAAGGAATDALTAAGTTGILSTVLEGARRMLSPNARRTRAREREANRGPDADVVRNQSRNLFQQLDNAGVAWSNQQSTTLVDDAINMLEGYDRSPGSVHAPLHGVIARLENLRGQPIPLTTLKQIREQIGSAAGSNEPQVRRIAGSLLNSIDGFVRQVDPQLSNLPPGQVGPMWQEARRLWRTGAAIDDVGYALTKAERRAASTNSGQNTENAIRQNITSLANKAEKPRRFNPYSPDEIAQMERVIEGTPTQNALRWAGNQLAGIPAQTTMGVGAGLGFLGGGIDSVTEALLTGGAGLAGTGLSTMAGHSLKQRSAQMAEDQADELVRLIATQGAAPGPRLQLQGPPTRANLANQMRQRMLALGAGRYIGSQEGQR